MAYIYKITNLINGKLYIGKTSNSIEERWQEHISDSQRERCIKRPLYDAFNKYGIKNFQIEEIEQVEDDELACQREIYWIDKLRTYIGFDDCNGYNATLGGDSKRYYNYKELANAYLELGTLKAVTDKFNCDPDTVKKACKENNILILSNFEIIKSKYSKKVAQLDPETLEIIKIYPSMKAAYRALGKGPNGAISKVCNGIQNFAYGYKWKFI